MNPSRSEPIATWSAPIASMWRSSTASDSAERLRVRAPDAVVDLVLGEDQPDHAAAGGDLGDRAVGEVVVLARRSGSRRGRPSPARRRRAARRSPRSRPRACGRCRRRRRSRCTRAPRPRRARLRPTPLLREEQVVERRRGGTAARACWSPPGARTGARARCRGRRGAASSRTFASTSSGVAPRWKPPSTQCTNLIPSPLRSSRGADHRVPGRLDVALGRLQQLDQLAEVRALGRRAVGLVEVHLAERAVQHAARHGHAARSSSGMRHPPVAVPVAEVEQPRGDASTAARSLPSSRARTLNIPRGTSRGSSTPPSRCMG